jgi:hypothetical protein
MTTASAPLHAAQLLQGRLLLLCPTHAPAAHTCPTTVLSLLPVVQPTPLAVVVGSTAQHGCVWPFATSWPSTPCGEGMSCLLSDPPVCIQGSCLDTTTPTPQPCCTQRNHDMWQRTVTSWWWCGPTAAGCAAMGQRHAHADHVPDTSSSTTWMAPWSTLLPAAWCHACGVKTHPAC